MKIVEYNNWDRIEPILQVLVKVFFLALGILCFIKFKWIILLIVPIVLKLYDIVTSKLHEKYFVVDKNAQNNRKISDISEKGFKYHIGNRFRNISWETVHIEDLNSEGLKLRVYKNELKIDRRIQNYSELLKKIPEEKLGKDIVTKYIPI